jgi:hypothetical protein
MKQNYAVKIYIDMPNQEPMKPSERVLMQYKNDMESITSEIYILNELDRMQSEIDDMTTTTKLIGDGGMYTATQCAKCENLISDEKQKICFHCGRRICHQ